MSEIAPNTLNYLIGKGKCYFDRLDVNGDSTGELDLGNDPVFSIAPTAENLDHYSSMEGHKKKDLSANVSTEFTLKFTLDEINRHNLNLAFWGDDIGNTAQGDGNINNAHVIAHLDRWVKNGIVYRDILEGSVVVMDDADVVTYVEGTDYNVDYDIGRIYAITGGAIAEGEVLHIDYSYQASSYPTIYAATRITIEGLLRFRGNCTYGSNYEMVCWRVKLAATGDVGFITDDWATVEFEAEVLADESNHPDSPYFDLLDISGGAVVES